MKRMRDIQCICNMQHARTYFTYYDYSYQMILIRFRLQTMLAVVMATS
jgi:hypothetical protein